MADRRERHPNRQVGLQRFLNRFKAPDVDPGFGVGDVVHMPDIGPVTVGTIDSKYFTGTTPEGRQVGQTGVGLVTGEKGSRTPAEPWRIERYGSIQKGK